MPVLTRPITRVNANATKTSKGRHEDAQDAPAQQAGTGAVAVGVVREVSMFEQVAQKGTANKKHEAKHGDGQEGNKRRRVHWGIMSVALSLGRIERKSACRRCTAERPR